ncbi:MAG: hypothetical protein JNL67_18525 [Planctomycetaceae bacterium]|nr:hypothetical protein [Planctomycetaceae bacterium]
MNGGQNMQTTTHKTNPFPTRVHFLVGAYRWTIVMLLSLMAGGCFGSNLSSVSHIAPPASRLPPTDLAETEPTPASTRAPATTASPSNLLAPPLPQDLPQVPLSRE